MTALVCSSALVASGPSAGFDITRRFGAGE